MVTGTAYSSIYFTVNYFSPLVQGMTYQGNIDIAAQDWSHDISVFGGFDKAEFSFSPTEDAIEDWIENGLGRVIRTYDESGTVMWEGFVNRIRVRMGGLEFSVGPLKEIINRAKLTYTLLDETDAPTTEGLKEETEIANDLESQQRYGIFYKILTTNKIDEEGAVQLRDMYLDQHAWPETSSSFSPSGTQPELRFDCLGFVYMLEYPYNYMEGDEEDAEKISISDKMRRILEEDPNDIFKDYGAIQENDFEVSEWEDADRDALSIFKAMVVLGDADLNRWSVGVYEDRRVVYEPVSTEVDYFIRLRDPNYSIHDQVDALVNPWHVRPGKWILFADFLPAFTREIEQLDRDPRALFIEDVSFRLPMGASFNGGKTTRISRKLAQLGLEGASA